MARLANDEKVACATDRLPYPYTLEDAQDFITANQADQVAGRGFALAIERSLDGSLIGIIGLRRNAEVADTNPTADATENATDNWELGYWLGREHWGQGYGTEAVRRLLRFAFETLGLAEIRAKVAVLNPASARLLAKAGAEKIADRTFATQGRCDGQSGSLWRFTRSDWRAAWSHRPLLLVAAAALVDPDGRVLMATRPPGKSMAGLWEFPGGKVDAGETPELALIRELNEELGINVGESCLAPLAFASHDYDSFHLLMPLYVIRSWVGQVTAREGQGLRWVRPQEMDKLPMPPADLPLVAILRDWIC